MIHKSQQWGNPDKKAYLYKLITIYFTTTETFLLQQPIEGNLSKISVLGTGQGISVVIRLWKAENPYIQIGDHIPSHTPESNQSCTGQRTES